MALPGRTNKIDIFTPEDFKYIVNPVSIGSVAFRVKTSHDAIIALASSISDLHPNFEVILGGWSNTQCSIRRKGVEKVSIPVAEILNGEEFRGFWIKWNGGNVTVGKEGEDAAFMSCNDSNPFQIGYVGFLTGWGASGVWKIEKFDSDIDLTTQDTGKFTYLPVSNGSATFRIRACGEAHIALTDRSDMTYPNAEIVILGGWSNTKSVIRRNHEKPDKAEVDTPNILSDTDFRVFWVKWNDDSISVGKDGEDLALLSWLDPDSIHVRHIGVSTGFGFSGQWRIENITSTVNERDLLNDDPSRFVYYDVPKTTVSFRVKANKEAKIALKSSTDDAADQIIEVIFGADDNSKSCIRSGDGMPDLSVVHTPNILQSNEFKGFWVRWSEGFIGAGYHGDNQAFMSWKHPKPYDIKLVGFCNGHWKINY